MLDKSVPYYNVIMRRNAGLPLRQSRLPEGYGFASFSEGKEEDWASVEASVGEFETKSDALLYFRKEYMPHREELARRLVFAFDPSGCPVATVTAWWNETDGRRVPSLHWLAVHPAHQGRGLGRALIDKCVDLLSESDPGRDIWLHTQTWSHLGIGLYLRAGFEFVKSGSFGGYRNEYELAEPILREIGVLSGSENN